MDEETILLVLGYIQFKLERAGISINWDLKPPSEIHLFLCILGEKFEQKYTQTFNEMCSNLHFTEEAAEETFNGVLDEVFEHGITWARIIASFSFAGSFALQFFNRNMTHHVLNVSNWFVSYINRNLETWISKQGGWNGIIDFLHERMEKKAATRQTFRNFFYGIVAGVIGVFTVGVVHNYYVIKS